MDLSKSINFLLENAGPVIQYRLRKEVLNNLSYTHFLSFVKVKQAYSLISIVLVLI
jgi:hypothetical protein